MPVSLDADYLAKRDVIEQVIREFGMTAEFPVDELVEGSEFCIEKARADLRDAVAVLADLSLERPSCYYEVGLAQALGKRTLLIAVDGTHIHQLYGRHLVRNYTTLESLRPVVEEALRDVN